VASQFLVYTATRIIIEVRSRNMIWKGHVASKRQLREHSEYLLEKLKRRFVSDYGSTRKVLVLSYPLSFEGMDGSGVTSHILNLDTRWS
jgi:hypothetical protein